MDDLRNKPESYWKEKLTPEQYKVCRLKITEPIWTSNLFPEYVEGVYKCVACGQPLFESYTKFDAESGGWPSFYKPISQDNVELHEYLSHGTPRTEVMCKNCGSHLGHLFSDGPSDLTGLRYSINSIALDFEPTAHWGW